MCGGNSRLPRLPCRVPVSNTREMKRNPFTNLKAMLGLLLAVALPSCLQNETTINLNKDGSGTIVEETYFTAAMLEMSTQFAEPGAPDPVEAMFTEEKAKAKAPKLGEGVEFVKMEMIEKDGMKGARTHYKFADISKISINPGSAMENLGDNAPKPDNADEESLKFEFADGELTILTPPTDFKNMAMEDAEEGQNPQMEEMMTKMMADMSIAIKLKATDGIEETNASYVDGDTVTLFEVQVAKMFDQKDKLKAISETAKTDKDAAIVEFKKLEGMKVETGEKVSVKLK